MHSRNLNNSHIYHRIEYFGLVDYIAHCSAVFCDKDTDSTVAMHDCLADYLEGRREIGVGRSKGSWVEEASGRLENNFTLNTPLLPV